ncbi:LTR-retrotransposon skipper, putative [Babesia ovata]|uniref:LTR-retrotransposon skipper, putative n=1 Tax=Babesia ovata TaxID=189622 RepID=A0A2H6KGU3_9APIC|nr:LTR-retrotransposon skipper, putative [Babesia ovata]GBE62189.1 LTR-retrotransposon skipper, putative [Babesia ovata]
MANSTLITVLAIIYLIMAVSFFFNGDAAPLNEKRPANTLNDDVRIYANGQRITYSELQFQAESSDQYTFVFKHAHFLKNTNYLRNVLAYYEGLHPFKPYLCKIVEYYERKLAETNGSLCVTFRPNELCTAYVGALIGITDTEVKLPSFELDSPEVIAALSCFPCASIEIQEAFMNFWMLLYQAIYETCAEKLKKLAAENAANGSQEASGVATAANLRDSNGISGNNEELILDCSRNDLNEEPWCPENGIDASPYIIGSLGAWNPEPDRPLDDSNESGEVAGSSNDGEVRDRNSSVSELSPEHQYESLSDFYIQPEVAEGDEDSDWDKYFESFLRRLKKLPDENVSSDASST